MLLGIREQPVGRAAVNRVTIQLLFDPRHFHPRIRGRSNELSGVSNQQRVAIYVDKILKGAKPADLPVEQPMTFQLIINRETAKTFGLTIPSEIMVQATKLID